MHLDNAQIVILDGTNSFEVKKLVNRDNLTDNLLIYDPLTYEKDEYDWLIDVKEYSEEFRSDIVSIWMDELHIEQLPELRNTVKQYSTFFNAKARRDKFASLNYQVTKPAHVHLAVMSVVAGVKNVSVDNILRAVLSDNLEYTNEIISEFTKYNALEIFWKMVEQATGYKSTDYAIASLAKHVVLTAACNSIQENVFKGLETYISSPHVSYCYTFLHNWQKEHDPKANNLIQFVEENLKIYRRFESIEIESIWNNEMFNCIDEIILKRIMTDIKNENIDSDKIIKIVEKRKPTVNYSNYHNYYDGVLYIAYMNAFKRKYYDGFTEVKARELFDHYTSEYYKMDTYYRYFHLAFNNSLQDNNQYLDGEFKDCVDYVEKLYTNWYLTKLNQKWNSLITDDHDVLQKDLYIRQQTRFYEDHIGTTFGHTDTRQFVIISDAMRYEVAKSLEEALAQETQCNVSTEAMQGIFPTITPFGMAALLPHTDKMTIDEKLNILIDGKSTERSNRENILKMRNIHSIAVNADDFFAMKRNERKELVNGIKVVYIYHDVIDASSHTNEKEVFNACEKAINELKNLVKIIMNDLTGRNIYITADHGFLYNYSPLQEKDKIGNSSIKKHSIDLQRRYVITDNEVAPEDMIEVPGIYNEIWDRAFAPKEIIRIKKPGAGLNFVHGGLSMQEMVVPVVKWEYVRTNSKSFAQNKDKYETRPVTLELVNSSRKISNKLFKISMFQTDPVSANRLACEYKIYFVDENETIISDINTIVADKTEKESKDREFTCTFTLIPMNFSNLKKYYLVVEDISGEQQPVKYEYQIDIAISTGEFDFFG